MKDGWRKKWVRIGVGLSVLSTLTWTVPAAGSQWGTKSAWAAESQQDALNRLGEVYSILQGQHVSGVSDEKLTDSAIQGMIESLKDPYTVYFTKEQYEAFNKDIAMVYVGIGTRLTQDKEGTRIVEVFPGGPAAVAGIVPGDYITQVNGTDTSGMTLDQIVSKVTGEEGTSVELTIRRKQNQFLFVNATRKSVTVPSVTSQVLADGTGYLQVSGFAETTDELFASQLDTLLKKPVSRLIIDLRNNPGGIVESAQHMAEQFIPEGILIHTKNRDGEDEPVLLRGGKSVHVPVVFLVNEDSASASEILVGAMQAYEKAKVVGTQTFGKGSVQSLYTLSSGGAVKVTIEEYFTAAWQPVNHKGITPDVLVQGSVPQFAAALRAAGAPEITVKLGPGTVTVNGMDQQELPLQPIRQDDRLYLPARLLTAMVGGALTWNGELQAIEVSANGAAAVAYGADSGFLNRDGVGYVDAARFQQQFPELTWEEQGEETVLRVPGAAAKEGR